MLSGMTPPSSGFLKGTSMASATTSFTSVCRRRQNSEFGSYLSKPLISEQSLDQEEVPTSTLPMPLAASSHSKLSINELPPPDEKSSFAQAVLNGKNSILFSFLV